MNERELSVCRVIDAPRERVFEAWTDPQKLARWWAPHGLATRVCEMDLRPGGLFRTVMQASDGTEYPTQGVYLEIVPNERIVFTDAYGEGWKPAEQPFMTVVVTFEDLGGKTAYEARVLHWTVEDRRRHEEMGFHEGWGQCLDQLVRVVTKE